MTLEEELEYIESTNKMIKLKRARLNVKMAMEFGMSEEDAKALYYRDIIEEQKK